MNIIHRLSKATERTITNKIRILVKFNSRIIIILCAYYFSILFNIVVSSVR